MQAGNREEFLCKTKPEFNKGHIWIGRVYNFVIARNDLIECDIRSFFDSWLVDEGFPLRIVEF